MEEILFIKYSGAGNDFILIDLSKNDIHKFSSAEIKKICARHTGIGADGVLLFNDSEEYDFELQYFNANGTTGSLCGNGARCAIHYAHESGRINTSVKFYSNKKIYSGEYLNDKTIKFNFFYPKNVYLNRKIKIDEFALNYSFADTGSPHVVIDIEELVNINTGMPVEDKLEKLNVGKIGKLIRNNKAFSPSGVNVNFIQYSETGINMRTYERGVEDETLSCGTGAVAVAIIEAAQGLVEAPVTLNTVSGEQLIVDFELNEKSINNLSLKGSAEQVYKGKIKLN